ncbi:MAG TPA: hypothetical protein PK990_07155 [Salinivirgaceae bacterium]|nr:hypothetical protein [Salinivirgaceae bacterium]
MSGSPLIITILFILTGVFQPAGAQLRITDINQLPQINGKLKTYMLSYCRKTDFFSGLAASAIETHFDKKTKKNTHSKSYPYRIPKDSLWQLILKTNPAKIWNSPIVRLISVYEPTTDTLLFPKSNHEFFLHENQIFFITLRYVSGLINLPTALKVTKIDHKKYILEFSYLEGGMAEGRQQLRLMEDELGGTIIEHQTFYCSHSAFRDKRLYPYFHTLAINELHNNLKKLSETTPN